MFKRSWRTLNNHMEKPSLDKLNAGAIRFNTDSSQMEIFDGNQWTGILATSPEQQTGGTRGIHFGGVTPSAIAQIDFFNVDSTGNAADFGDTLVAKRYLGGFSNGHGGLS